MNLSKTEMTLNIGTLTYLKVPWLLLVGGSPGSRRTVASVWASMSTIWMDGAWDPFFVDLHKFGGGFRGLLRIMYRNLDSGVRAVVLSIGG